MDVRRDDTPTGNRTYSLLQIYADTYESVAKLRMGQMNRLRCWLRDTLPKEQWGDVDFADEAINDRLVYEHLPNDQRDFVDSLRKFEKDAERYMAREIKRHPLWPWLEQVRGIGPVLGAKLLKRLGDLHRFPSPAHLWSYCGLDGDRWRRKTEEGKKTYSPRLLSVCWLISEQFQRTPPGASVYREIYDRRKDYERTKPPCEKCAQAGQEEACRPVHINLKARRYVVKCLLRDLWIYATGAAHTQAAD